ncbi:MAG: CPBP family intramembrane glutamic endopeptidase [Verrucomicrobiales bacterium]|nr:CPBP family intramembrane metalloprotease [Verrucomicrobiota bacterium JB025]
MKLAAAGNVMKVWLYAVASVLLGAWVAPLFFNAGMALAEVSAAKSTNGALEWLAGKCGEVDFPVYYGGSILLVAMILFVPWVEWLSVGTTGEPRVRPWTIRVGHGCVGGRGQALERNVRGLWHCCAGFLIVSGLLLSIGAGLVPAGLISLKGAVGGHGELALRTLAKVAGLAVVMEVFFRGIVMGVFLRAMRPAAALGMSAAFFALTLCVVPWGGLDVADPEASGIGFELLEKTAMGFGDGRVVMGRFAPLLALGGVLSYVRWRTASLWMPIGLHAGWLFAAGMLGELTEPVMEMGAREWVISGGLLQQGLVPMLGIFLAGMLAHFLTDKSDERHEAEL